MVFNDANLGATYFGMDGAGNMLLAAEANQNATVDIVAYRGTLAGGFGAQQVLDGRGAAAALKTMTVGVGGQSVILWTQNNGNNVTMFAASRVTAQDAFEVDDLGISPPSSRFWVTISDAGTAYYFDIYQGVRFRWVGGVWDSVVALPDMGFTSADGYAATRNGDFVAISDDSNFWAKAGLWVSYDAIRNEFIQAPDSTSPGPGFALGLNTTNKSVGYQYLALSQSGVAILTLRNQYDLLPTPAVPAGDGRAVTNVWGLMLK